MIKPTITIVGSYYLLAHCMRATPGLDDALPGIISTWTPMFAAGVLGGWRYRWLNRSGMPLSVSLVCAFLSCVFIAFLPTLIRYLLGTAMQLWAGLGVTALMPEPTGSEVLAFMIVVPLIVVIGYLPTLVGLVVGSRIRWSGRDL